MRYFARDAAQEKLFVKCRLFSLNFANTFYPCVKDVNLASSLTDVMLMGTGKRNVLQVIMNSVDN